LSENSAMSVWDQNHFSLYIYWQSLCLNIKIDIWVRQVRPNPKTKKGTTDVFAASSFKYLPILVVFGSVM
jgi:hypothetical protein